MRKKMAADFKVKTGYCSEMKAGQFDLFVNATPVGMNSDQTPVPNPADLKERIVVDFVNYPSETRLIREARAAGARVVTGRDIWIYQGLSQLKLWLGEDFTYGDLSARL